MPGQVVGMMYVPAGYVKIYGATVQRNDYIRLVNLADKYSLWTTDTVNNPGKFGVGNGTTTMVLPDWRGVVRRFLDDGKGYDTGRVLGTFQEDNFQGHKHVLMMGTGTATSTPMSDTTLGCHIPQALNSNSDNPVRTPLTDSSFGNVRTGIETRSKNIAEYAVIKY